MITLSPYLAVGVPGDLPGGVARLRAAADGGADGQPRGDAHVPHGAAPRHARLPAGRGPLLLRLARPRRRRRARAQGLPTGKSVT